MKTIIKLAGILLMVNTCHATMIYSELVDLGANQYQYNYQIENDALLALDNFSLFFDVGKTSNLVVLSAPLDWQTDVYQPDLLIPADGFLDVYTELALLAQGQTLNGLSVFFDWTGSTLPVAQGFEIYDEQWNIVESGYTTLKVSVDEPSTLLLLGIGVIGLLVSRLKPSKIKEVLS